MQRFRLKANCGNHIGPPDKDGNRVTYKAGSTVPSNDDLVAKYPNKFELVSGQDLGNVPTAPKIPISSKGKGKSKKKKAVSEFQSPEHEHELVELGVDVTKEFPTASEVKLEVFEKSKWFTVVDPENDEVLNEKKLRRDKVEGFLKDYLQDDEDEGDDEGEDEDGKDEGDDDDEE